MIVFSWSENPTEILTEPSYSVVTAIRYHTSATSNAPSAEIKAANRELAYLRDGGERFGGKKKKRGKGKAGMLWPQTVLPVLAF